MRKCEEQFQQHETDFQKIHFESLFIFLTLKMPSTGYCSGFKCFPNVLELLDGVESMYSKNLEILVRIFVGVMEQFLTMCATIFGNLRIQLLKNYIKTIWILNFFAYFEIV